MGAPSPAPSTSTCASPSATAFTPRSRPTSSIPAASSRGRSVKGSFAIAARRSYVDAIIGLFQTPGLRFTTAPVYYDYQGIFEYPLGGGRFRALLSGSDDQLILSFSRPQDADPAISAFGTHIWYHKLQVRWTRSVGHWAFYLQNSTGLQGQSGQLGRSLNFDIFAVGSDSRVEARWSPSPKLRVLFGADSQYGNVDIAANIPPPPAEGQIPGPLSSTPSFRENEKLNVGNLGIYAEATWKPNERVTLTPGLRFDYFSALAGQAFNPRLTGRVRARRRSPGSRRASASSRRIRRRPTTIPTSAIPGCGPSRRSIISSSVEQGILPGLMAEATGFYKELYDLVVVSSNRCSATVCSFPSASRTTASGASTAANSCYGRRCRNGFSAGSAIRSCGRSERIARPANGGCSISTRPIS